MKNSAIITAAGECQLNCRNGIHKAKTTITVSSIKNQPSLLLTIGPQLLLLKRPYGASLRKRYTPVPIPTAHQQVIKTSYSFNLPDWLF
jgi:hypothetical protein